MRPEAKRQTGVQKQVICDHASPLQLLSMAAITVALDFILSACPIPFPYASVIPDKAI